MEGRRHRGRLRWLQRHQQGRDHAGENIPASAHAQGRERKPARDRRRIRRMNETHRALQKDRRAGLLVKATRRGPPIPLHRFDWKGQESGGFSRVGCEHAGSRSFGQQAWTAFALGKSGERIRIDDRGSAELKRQAHRQTTTDLIETKPRADDDRVRPFGEGEGIDERSLLRKRCTHDLDDLRIDRRLSRRANP